MKVFMVQGGDPTSKNAAPGTALGSGNHGDRIPAEFKTDKYIHKRGALAAARDNNPQKASSGCQFYIVIGKKATEDELNMIQQRIGITYTDAQKNIYKTIGGTPFLDNNYTVYGEVIKGIEIADKIVAEKRNQMDRPDKDQKIISAKVFEKNAKGKYVAYNPSKN
jgi:cyclophilin family peptidyl-prolyl cis-trans isomerase